MRSACNGARARSDSSRGRDDERRRASASLEREGTVNGRLNLFQSAMLRWRALHPYCASHVIAVDAPLDEARLRSAIAAVLEECGLTGLELHRRRFRWTGGPASVSLDIVDGDGAAFDAAAAMIERTINQPFPRDGRFDPFRFFAVRDGPRCLVGLTYDHFVAGGDSIVVLVTDIADRYVAAGPSPLPRLSRYPPTYWRLFARHAGALLRGLAALRGLLAGWRSAIRPHFGDPSDGTNGYAHALVTPERCTMLRAGAKKLGVTTNDLLLALLVHAVMPIAACRHHTGRRRQIALASIVNVRADYQPPATEVFGQFLSSFRIVHPFAEGRPIADTARDVFRQTRRAKDAKLYLVTLVALAAAALMWPFASERRRHRLYLKYHPVFAGLTPLTVDTLRRQGRTGDGGYLRAASTGPMSPMVVAVSVAGSAMRLGITYRTTALTRADVDRVIASVLQDMDTL